VSIYEGTITFTVRFASDNGYEADEALKDIATEIQSAFHDDLPYDEVSGEIDEDRVFDEAGSLIVDWTTGKAHT
jgi:hypothetical protein